MKNMEIPDLSDLSAFIYYDGDNTASFFWRYRVSMEKENEMKKEYLLKYRGHVRRINRIEAELSELRTMKLSISVNNDGMPHGSGRSDMSGYAAELDELERNLIQEKYRRMVVHKEISAQIRCLDSETERDILFYRYIKGLNWWEIAEQMGYSERHITRLHGKALAHFQFPKKDKMS